MASMAISGASAPSVTSPAGTAKSAPAQTETSAKAPAVLQPDSVKLSAGAEAKLMHQEGQSVALIAASLGINVSAVNDYLNIIVATPVSATPAAASTAPATPVAATVSPNAAAKS